MPSELFKAKWSGPFNAQVGPGQILQPGDEYEVTAEDLKSGHWVAVGKDAKALEKDALAEAEAQAAAAAVDVEPAPDAPTDEVPS